MTPAFPAGFRSGRSRFVRAMTFLACLVGQASTLSAQGIEVTPFGGYRFGGDFFELLTGQPLDIDGAPSVGVIVDVPTGGVVNVPAGTALQSANHGDVDLLVYAYGYPPEDATAELLEPAV